MFFLVLNIVKYFAGKKYFINTTYFFSGGRSPAPAYPAYRKRSVGEETKPMATVVSEISKLLEEKDALKIPTLLEEKDVWEKPREAKHYHGPAPAYPSYGGGGFGPAPAYPAYGKRSVGDQKTEAMSNKKVILKISKLSIGAAVQQTALRALPKTNITQSPRGTQRLFVAQTKSTSGVRRWASSSNSQPSCIVYFSGVFGAAYHEVVGVLK